MKYAVLTYPPLAFRGISMAIGVLAIAAYMTVRKDSFYVRSEERTPIIKLVLGNMLIWHVFAIYAIKFLTSGRAAILGYTMPVWAMIIGVLLYRDRLTWRGLVGVLLALAATVLLALDEFTSLVGQPLGLGLMLFAAFGWGLGTVMMNRTHLSISNTSLTFWMMVATVPVLGVLSMALELEQWRTPTTGEWGAILYNALLVFCICHIIWFRLARKLPPIASSLSIMLIPIVGVGSGAWALNETLGVYDIAALGLIVLAMSVVLLPRTKRDAVP
jgi:drug/metabolite transporter (DMT)-like permease